LTHSQANDPLNGTWGREQRSQFAINELTNLRGERVHCEKKWFQQMTVEISRSQKAGLGIAS
jgi:hypothetical protein